MEATLWASIDRLAPLHPDFVSVTYGAGGATRERTHATLARLVRETDVRPAAHLTCVAASRAEVDDVARDYWSVGVRHIVALRGDPQTGPGTAYEAHAEGYADLDRARRGHQAHRRFRDLGLGLSREAIPRARRSTPTSTC